MATLYGIQLIPPPVTAPDCRRCHKSASRLITRRTNRNANANRPYYKCIPCNKFIRFDDERGNDSRNPLCHCQESSKMQVSGVDKRVPRGLHYVCRSGTCDYYEVRRDAQQQQITLDEDLVNALAMLKFI